MAEWRRHAPIILATSLVWALFFGAYLLFGQRRPPVQPIEIVPPPTLVPTRVAETPTPARLRVYVSGAVVSPGVYRLAPDSLVEDAINAAGGAAANADLIAINLAHPLSDGEQIYVPLQGESDRPSINSSQSSSQQPVSTDRAAPSTGKRIDLNRATAAELETLSGVGPKTAAAIIEGRPYATVDDLLRVKGIGPATLEKLRPHVTVGE
ncbi:MAG: ComEA family DNA-binding protein [Chloroflexi bacterium]|nr:ComEA family DNA-binding protein [Chloroflexota bacterium]